MNLTDKLIGGIKKYFRDTEGKTAIIGISGGKDSTVAAALCVKALGKENVIGILMPNGNQSDIDDSIAICKFLDIQYFNMNIDKIYKSFFELLTNQKIEPGNQAKINLAPRIRMTLLYYIAQSYPKARVINTTNACEAFVGYGTLWGDTIGDFSIFKNIKVSEIYAIGDDLGLPYNLVHKTPSDGLTGKSDEDNLEVTYADIETYMNTESKMDNNTIQYNYPKLQEILGQEKLEKIWKLNYNSIFKRKMINLPTIEI